MEPEVKLISHTDNSEYNIVYAARVCYSSMDESDSRWVPTENAQTVLGGGNITINAPMAKIQIGPNDEKLLRKLMSNQHNSTLRFAWAFLNIRNISRICSHELVRISCFGLLQKSDRYTKSTEDMVPDTIFGIDDEVDKLVDQSLLLCRQAYEKALEKGIKKEDARYILPSGSMTELNMSSNFQGWQTFFKLRLSPKVLLETRLVAIECAKLLYGIAPIVFEESYDKALKLEREL